MLSYFHCSNPKILLDSVHKFSQKAFFYKNMDRLTDNTSSMKFKIDRPIKLVSILRQSSKEFFPFIDDMIYVELT